MIEAAAKIGHPPVVILPVLPGKTQPWAEAVSELIPIQDLHRKTTGLKLLFH
jgi:hypothetical protein